MTNEMNFQTTIYQQAVIKNHIFLNELWINTKPITKRELRFVVMKVETVFVIIY